MITVKRNRHIHAAPAAVFAALSDPDKLSALLPRVRRIELIESEADYARIATHMAFGPFGEIRSEGQVRWQTDHEVVFSSRLPLPVESRWTLTAVRGGTDLCAALSLDLSPLIGPFAALVPPKQVTRLITPDLDNALTEIASRVESRDERTIEG